MDLPKEPKIKLIELTPLSYVGAAVKLARMVDTAVKATVEKKCVSSEKVKMCHTNLLANLRFSV